MPRLALLLCGVLAFPVSFAARAPARDALRDLHFGEGLYQAYQDEHFAAIARLDTELGQYYGLDEPGLDTLHFHINQAEFSVGDLELNYRMHLRAGRAMRAVLEGNVEPVVRNEAAYRLARLHFQKDQPGDALTALERIQGKVPEKIRDDLAFLRGNVYLAVGRFGEAAQIFRALQSTKGYEGYAAYNLGIAELRAGREQDALQSLARAGQAGGSDPAALAIRDKANLVLGGRLLDAKQPQLARQYLERVRLNGPFSAQALLASGWADASAERYDRALVPWSLLVERHPTDKAVQEALLAVPYAYGRLNIHGKAALGYGRALEAFGAELERLHASARSVREGKFLAALTRGELKQDPNWVIRLRELPESPETYYLMELMASHDFQESLKNYLDLEALRRHCDTWEANLDAWEDLIARRRAYYEPLLPELDRQFRALDSQMRLRVEQRDRLDKRIKAMRVAPRPDLLATAEERVYRIALEEIEKRHGRDPAVAERIARLLGVLAYRIHTGYDRRLTDAWKHLEQLDAVIEALRRQYTAYVRTRQAAAQSYQGYDATLQRLRTRIQAAREQSKMLTARQGHLLEAMALGELEQRITRLEEYQVKARFALADSYDRAVKAQGEGGRPQ
jgi:predicted  nucleic acid-binding Zn-ribbon protein